MFNPEDVRTQNLSNPLILPIISCRMFPLYFYFFISSPLFLSFFNFFISILSRNNINKHSYLVNNRIFWVVFLFFLETFKSAEFMYSLLCEVEESITLHDQQNIFWEAIQLDKDYLKNILFQFVTWSYWRWWACILNSYRVFISWYDNIPLGCLNYIVIPFLCYMCLITSCVLSTYFELVIIVSFNNLYIFLFRWIM